MAAVQMTLHGVEYWGFVNAEGELVIPPEFASVGDFYNGIAYAQRQDGIFVLINETGRATHEFPPGMRVGEQMFAPQIPRVTSDFAVYDLPDNRDRHFMITQQFDVSTSVLRHGVVNRHGETVLPPRYTGGIGYFTDGRARVSNGLTSWGYIDTYGVEIAAPRYQYALPFANGVAVVHNVLGTLTRYSAIDIHGNEVIPQSSHSLYSFRNGLARQSQHIERVTPSITGAGPATVTTLNVPTRFINTLGEVVIPGGIDGIIYAQHFSEGLAAVLWESIRYYCPPVGHAGRTCINTCFGHIDRYWGYIDSTGALAIDLQFGYAKSFSDGMAAVSEMVWDASTGQYRRLWGFINTVGDLVIPHQFEWVSDFENGYALVNRGGEAYYEFWNHTLGSNEQIAGGQFMLIDRWGRVVLDLSDFDLVLPMSEGVLAVGKGIIYAPPSQNHNIPMPREVLEGGTWGFIRLVYE
jgi:hypothetical protein